MRNLVQSVVQNKASDLFPDKKMCATSALKDKYDFKGCTFPHQDNMVTDVMDETSVNLLDKFIKEPTMVDAQSA